MDGIDWLHFPPLTALRAFDATARSGGFSPAARILNVTHAAVSQQVRALEAHLGVPLVLRAGRKLTLTDEGEILAAALTDGFAGIQSAVNGLRSRNEERPVAITLTPTFANNWLMSRLGRFWAKHPDIPVSLHPDPRVLDLPREHMDFGIRIGNGTWPGVDALFLTSARYVIVGAPRLVGETAPLTPHDMASLPWVLEPDWPEQRDWIARATGLDPAALKITEFETEELALTAARQSLGLYVASVALIEDDLRSGALSVAFDPQEEHPGYYIVTPPGPLRRKARVVQQWLLASV